MMAGGERDRGGDGGSALGERQPLLIGGGAAVQYDTDYTLANARRVYDGLIRRAKHQLVYVCLVDLIATATIWIIVMHGFRGDWQSSDLVKSITGYTFQRSLLDVACVGAARVLVLILAYGPWRSSPFIFMLITTLGSIAFIVVKICFFDFTAKVNNLAYLMFIVELAFPMVEGYLWVTNLGPLQRDSAMLYTDGYRDIADPANVRRLATTQQITRPHESSMLHIRRPLNADSLTTPPRAPAYARTQINSDEEEALHVPDSPLFRTPPSEAADAFYQQAEEEESQTAPSTQASFEQFPLAATSTIAQHMILRGQNAVSDVERFATHDRNTNGVSMWRNLFDKNGVTVSVLAGSSSNNKTPIYKCEGLVWSSPEMLFRFLHDDFDEVCARSSLWQSMKVQRTFDKHTDLVHVMLKSYIASPPRDLTVVRSWQYSDNKFTLAFNSVEDPLVPKRRNFVRAYDRGSGFHLQRVHAESNVTKLTCVLHMDLKVTGIFAPSKLEGKIVERMSRIHDEIRTALESRAGSADRHARHTFA
ncbi:hypothetical protein PTSG_08346 [Salpingoeca rosetta]|uniref:START domain-containing protein n=1 Tax=Salpingoeca rosetta (strain ATCC 50818 / BSB-021) TaxID=946362 RepID=F2UJF4_SALR5|nr:uncharacterized protein PTSG_08346 [Salpingoeca rosetta]EGD77253.1 hypothetical protein PTSG_08346 [Salpingoeca rosetta]|eukprot:XP_004990597.1 hypothetical protein PTSG_08346 [Salpingoeca rosetta]